MSDEVRNPPDGAAILPISSKTTLLRGDASEQPGASTFESDVLVVVEANDPALVGRTFPLTQDEIIVCREGCSGIVLPFDDALSRSHAKFVRSGRGWACADMGSTNGTKVNGTRIRQQTSLRPGDRVSMGSTTLLFVAQEESSDALPMPLALADSLVDAQRGEMARLKAVIDGIDRVMRFLTAAQLGTLLQGGDAGSIERLAMFMSKHRNVRDGRALSLGDWHALTFGLARLVEDGEDPIARISKALRQNRLDEKTGRAVQLRNQSVVGHGWVNAEEALVKDEKSLRDTLRMLIGASHPLCRTRLVSMAQIVDVDDLVMTYDLHTHQGPREVFPLERWPLPRRLAKLWTYLLTERGEAICLAPIVASTLAEGAEKREVFLAEGIILGDKGVPVTMRAITSTNWAAVELPALPNLARLADLVRAAKPKSP